MLIEGHGLYPAANDFLPIAANAKIAHIFGIAACDVRGESWLKQSGFQMNPPPQRQIVRKLVDSREVIICDNCVDPDTMKRVNEQINGLVYSRTLLSRSDLPEGVGGSVAHIQSPLLEQEPFYAALRRMGESLFPAERFQHEQTYVNHGIYGDVFLPHNDCPQERNDITVLYYANLGWHSDWLGETIFYREGYEAELAVTARPGRIVVFRGGIFHRGGVPSRVCFQARLTIACKLLSA